MQREGRKQRILILGASGFIGNSLYRELYPYFDVHGTYCTQIGAFSENRVFHHFCDGKDNLSVLLDRLRPTIVISAMKGQSKNQIEAHRQLVDYTFLNPKRRVFYISSSEVFDAYKHRPFYENDTVLSESASGKLKISLEKLLQENLFSQTTIVRLPLVLGINSHEIFHLRQCIRHRATFEVFPNLVVTATTSNKICQQIHYCINQSLRGIVHLASNDLIHHDELFREITSKIGVEIPIFKNVFSSNEDRYKAILSKNKMPEPYQITVSEVIEESSLSEEIVSIK